MSRRLEEAFNPVEGAAMRGLWEALDLADVPALEAEAGDVDSWADLAEVLAGLDRVRKIGSVNLHDWIDELCDTLDIETEVDEALILDLAKQDDAEEHWRLDYVGLTRARERLGDEFAAAAGVLRRAFARPRGDDLRGGRVPVRG